MPRKVALAAAHGPRAAVSSRATTRRLGFAVLLAVAPINVVRAQSAAETPLVLQLQGPPEFEDAGYYAALWKGFYDAAGLHVEIRPGSPPGQTTIDPAREVTEGRAQFGVGSMQLVVRTGQGLPLLLLAPIFQSSGAAIYYRADSEFNAPGALLKGKVARLPATDILDLELATALRGDGIDPFKVNSVPVEPGHALAALADHSVDAVAGSAWEFPWRARTANLAVKSFNPADYRVEFYGDTLFTLGRYERANPEIVRQFRAATLKGWAYALDHPDEIAARLTSELPTPGIADPAGFARYQAGVARDLARYPEISLGHSSPERWGRIEQTLANAGALVRTADPDNFVYDPEAEARSRTDWRAGAILGLTALVIVAVTAALLWQRGRRKRRTPGALALSPALAGAPPAQIAAGIGGEPPPPLADASAAEIAAGIGAAPPLPAALAEADTPEPLPAPAQSDSAQSAAAQPPWGEPATAEPAAPEPALATLLASQPPSSPGAEAAATPAPTTDLNTLLTALEPALRRLVPDRIGFRLSLLADLWRCETDGAVVAAVVAELVGAATAELKPDDTLIVGTRNAGFEAASLADYPDARLGEFARITVRDSGPGFDLAGLDSIFDPAATARPAVAAAAPAMHKLGGFARAESAEGIGTAIHLYFPRVASDEKPPAKPDGKPEEPAPAAAKRYRASGSRSTQRRSRSLR